MKRLLLVALCLSSMKPLYAAITVSGDVDPAYPYTDPWDVIGTLTVGWDAVGSVTVSSGSRITSQDLYLGYDSTGDGTVTVTGSSSLVDNAREIWLGSWGFGDMLINQGGRVITEDMLIGVDDEGLGEGRLAVSGSSSRMNASDELQVGYTATGVMLVEQGATVTSAFGTVGAYPTSAGIAQVIDSGSRWINSGTLYVGGDDYGQGGTGIINVSDGGLVQAAEIMVYSSGRLEGNGTVQATQVINDGTMAPEGQLSVQGDLIMGGGSTLDVWIDDTGASDRVSASGLVTLEGGTVKVNSVQTITAERDYLILDGSSVQGGFTTIDRSQVVISLPVHGIPDIWFGYSANAAYLSVVALPFDDPEVTQTANQLAVGQALEDQSNRGGSSITNAVSDIQSLKEVRTAYDQLSGQSRTALPSISLGIIDGYNSLLSRRLYEQPSPWTGNKNKEGGGWAQLYGLGSSRREEVGRSSYRIGGAGAGIGYDRWWTDLLLVGIAGGVSKSKVSYTGGHDEADVTSSHLGVYSRLASDPWRLDTQFSYSDLSFDTQRYVSLMNERLDSNTKARALSGSLEAAWMWYELLDGYLEPLIGGRFTRMQIQGHQEQGGDAALDFSSQTWTSMQSSLGLHWTSPVGEIGVGEYYADVAVRWLHEFGEQHPSVTTSFVNDRQNKFTVQDTMLGRDGLQLDLGIQAGLTERTRLLLNYQCLFNEDRSYHVFGGAVQYRF